MNLIKYIVLILALPFCLTLEAQTTKWKDMYKVKKKDTLFGIARSYGITVDELISANPEMKVTGYELKKGDYIFIPFPSNTASTTTTKAESSKVDDIRKRAIRVGIMLPLHDVDGDGKRMVEYYRGFLMACDSLKKQNISVEINAWNVPIDADVRQVLLDKNASQCDIIFGPLYTQHVKPLADFCSRNDIKLVIPFSINGDEVTKNKNIYQVYQTNDEINNMSIQTFVARFSKYHPVFVDCNDLTSKKGIFTSALRNKLESLGIKYNITNIKSSEEAFAKAFSRTQPNIVILNTGRSPELNIVLAKLNGLKVNSPGVNISLFGYTDWLMYTKNNLDNFFKYNTYIPTTFYYNPLSYKTQQLENHYYRWFHVGMQYALPRFALTGYDHAHFFLLGLHKYGTKFNGTKSENTYVPLQTPLHFKRVGNGGMQNSSFMLIHYTNDHKIELINY